MPVLAPALVAALLTAAPSTHQTRILNRRIERNQVLATALRSAGLDGGQTDRVVAALQGVFDFRKSRVGDQLRLVFRDGELDHFDYRQSPAERSAVASTWFRSMRRFRMRTWGEDGAAVSSAATSAGARTVIGEGRWISLPVSRRPPRRHLHTTGGPLPARRSWHCVGRPSVRLRSGNLAGESCSGARLSSGPNRCQERREVWGGPGLEWKGATHPRDPARTVRGAGGARLRRDVGGLSGPGQPPAA